MIKRSLLMLVLTAVGGCGESGSTPRQRPSPTPVVPVPVDPAPTTAAAPIECGLIDEWAGPNLCAPNREAVFACFLGAFHTDQPARFVWRATGDDNRGQTEWTVAVGASKTEIVIHASAEHEPMTTLHCPTTGVERSVDGCNVLAIRNCTCDPPDRC